MALTSYIKTLWKNLQVPAINANNLNKIEKGIYNATEQTIQNDGAIAVLQTQVNKTYEFDKFQGGTANPMVITDQWTTILDKDLGRKDSGVYEYKHSITFKMSVVNKSAEFRFSLNGGTTWEERFLEVKDKTNIEDTESLFPMEVPQGGIDVHMKLEAKTETASGEHLDIYYASQILEEK